MVREHFLDFDGTYGHMWASGYRCMNCGNVHDPLIEQHRLANAQPKLVVANGEADRREGDRHAEVHSVVMRAA
ncbi:MAG: hypothetical protein CV081_06290 [Nitrospira sp. LK265]|nr:hypothetical protein [Nitrospira sp. LK265]